MERWSDALWNPWLLIFFLVTGLYLSLRTGFFQFFGARTWLKVTLGFLFRRKTDQRGDQGALTQFQAMATALAATIGTGSIAGVATAIFYGGPGAVFWMWISALLGMMTGFVEKTLAVRYRRRTKDGWRGGPMEYMEEGLGMRWMALWFALAVTVAALGGGGLVQANSISTSLSAVFGWGRLPVGIVTAAVTGLVVAGGIGRIGAVCEKLVPVMALGFIGGGIVVLACRADAILPTLREIVISALAPEPVIGGGLGYGMMTAMRYGVARGVFTNEAGLGSSAMAHAQARVKDPAEQGMWGIFEVFVATLVVCTVSALVILTTGVYDKETALTAIQTKTVTEAMAGAPLSAAAFSTVFGRWGGLFVAVCLLLFAFSSLLGWSYYGERGLEYLTGSQKGRGAFRVLFLAAILWGSVGNLELVWQLSDLCNGLMALPNLIAILLLSPEALRLWRGCIEKSTRKP